LNFLFRTLKFWKTYDNFRVRALKLESCRKSQRLLNVFALPNFKGEVVPLEFVVAITLQPKAASNAKVSSGYTP